jgi:hypothetical protein
MEGQEMSTDEKWVIIKRGLFYKPDGCGYTGIRDHAGRYTRDEAMQHACPAAGCTVMRLQDAPEFTGACFDDLARNHLRAKRDVLLDALTKVRSNHSLYDDTDMVDAAIAAVRRES